jgi:hypothetical protein
MREPRRCHRRGAPTEEPGREAAAPTCRLASGAPPAPPSARAASPPPGHSPLLVAARPPRPQRDRATARAAVEASAATRRPRHPSRPAARHSQAGRTPAGPGDRPGRARDRFADGAIYRGAMRGSSYHGKGEYVSKSFKYDGEFM